MDLMPLMGISHSSANLPQLSFMLLEFPEDCQIRWLLVEVPTCKFGGAVDAFCVFASVFSVSGIHLKKEKKSCELVPFVVRDASLLLVTTIGKFWNHFKIG